MKIEGHLHAIETHQWSSGSPTCQCLARYTPVANSLVDARACSAELTEFERMAEDQVKSLINSCRLKTCILDPLPASIMKDCIDVLLAVLTTLRWSTYQLKLLMCRCNLRKLRKPR